MSRTTRSRGHFSLVASVAVSWLVLGALLSVHAENAEEVYRKCVHGVVWIVNKTGWFSEARGSGFLIDRNRRLVVTNHHVTEGRWYMDVYFPLRDAKGDLITDTDFYKRNVEALRRQGYATVGCVVAYDPEKDLSILRLSALPKDAVELKTAFGNPSRQSCLHVIGHPAGRPLWSYCPGIEPQVTDFKANAERQACNFKAVVYKSGVFNGNSGGPVLNERGQVVGVNARKGGEGGMWTVAVHWQEIDNLLDTVQPHHVVGIENGTRGKIFYQIRWGDGKWENIEIAPKERYVHWWRGDNAPKPQIRFDCSAEAGYQEKKCELECSVHELGKNVKPDFERDARKYVFRWKENKTLELDFQR